MNKLTGGVGYVDKYIVAMYGTRQQATLLSSTYNYKPLSQRRTKGRKRKQKKAALSFSLSRSPPDQVDMYACASP